MGSNYRFVAYRPHLKSQVIALQTHLWSPSPALNTAYFEWKYERNPYLKEPLIRLAMHDGEVIGMRGFFGVQWEAGTPPQQFPSLYADDMVIAPGHRHHGLMFKIMTSAFEDLATKRYEFVFNLSAGLVTLRSSLSMGWRSAGWARPMRWRSWRTALRSGFLRCIERPPNTSRSLERLSSLRSATSRRSLEDFDLNRINRLLRENPAISIENAPNCAAMAELVSRVGGHGKIRHVRNCEYFQWRFQNPLSRYRFVLWKEDRLEGYLVLQEYTSQFAGNEVNIVDWEATNEWIQAGLLRAAFAFANGRRLVIWSATLPQYLIELLKRNRFRSAKPPTGPAPPAILVRPLRQDQFDGKHVFAGRPLLDLASWDLRMLYSMHG